MSKNLTKVVSVRIPQEYYDVIVKLGEQHGYSTSQTVRKILTGEMIEIVEINNKRPLINWKSHERMRALDLMEQILTGVNRTRDELNRIGVNVNQLAKSVNMNNISDVYVSAGLNNFSNEVLRLWHSINEIGWEVDDLWQLYQLNQAETVERH